MFSYVGLSKRVIIKVMHYGAKPAQEKLQSKFRPVFNNLQYGQYTQCTKGGKVQSSSSFWGGWFMWTHQITAVNTLTQAQLLSHPNVPFTGS
jgi:hypothetical protein